MQNTTPRHLLTASGLALLLALSPALAQDANSPAAEAAQAAANDNQPLSAPESTARAQQVMPESFADLVEMVSPAVVNITTTATVSSPLARGPQLPEGSPFSDLFREFGFPGMPDGGDPFGGPRGEQRSNALGSGFVVSSDGLIVTNNHVIDGADEIEIEFFSGKKLPAKVIGKDEKTDIAVLKVESAQLQPLKLGDSDSVRVGEYVLAIGNPLSSDELANTITFGIVSATKREVTIDNYTNSYLQTDAAINFGNSGGPLNNLNGEVIGINSAKTITAGYDDLGNAVSAEGFGFALPINQVKKIMEVLIT